MFCTESTGKAGWRKRSLVKQVVGSKAGMVVVDYKSPVMGVAQVHSSHPGILHAQSSGGPALAAFVASPCVVKTATL